MQRSRIVLTAAVLLVAVGSEGRAQPNAIVDICAADDDSALSPKQRIDACTTLIEAAKDGTPEDLAKLLINRGAAFWYGDRTKQAIADFDRAIALDPKNARAYRERANAHRDAGRLDKALADANNAVRLDPNDAVAFDVRGNVFNNNRQYDRAIADYREAIRLDPKFAQAYMDLGVAFYFKQDYQDAIASYDQAIKLNPRSSRAFTNRGAAYKKLGRGAEALADESEAIKLDPADPINYDNRGLSYQSNGEHERAIADFDEAIRLRPQSNFLSNRGDSYQARGNYDRAISDYDRAIALEPGYARAYNNRGAAWRSKGDIDRAIADYESALRANPHLDEAAENLAYLRRERDRRRTVDGGNNVRPTFDCRTAKRAAEKAICSDPELSRLDREIAAAYEAALAKLARRDAAQLRRQQREFLARRDRLFGRPDYQFKRDLERRLSELRDISG